MIIHAKTIVFMTTIEMIYILFEQNTSHRTIKTHNKTHFVASLAHFMAHSADVCVNLSLSKYVLYLFYIIVP